MTLEVTATRYQTVAMHAMSNKLHLSTCLRNGLIGFAVCTFVAVFLTIQWYFAPAGDGHAPRWFVVLGHYSLVCYLWGLLTIGILPSVARIGFDRNRLVRSVAKLLVVGIGFSIVHFLIGRFFVLLFGWLGTGGIHGGTTTLLQIIGIIQSNLILFTVIASGCLAVSYSRKYRDRELLASRLESQLTRAQLGALKSQLQPHFLFNTLNAIAALVVENPSAAEKMIVKLSDLLRSTLENVKVDRVELRKELEFSRQYLEIEKMRFGDRLVIVERIEPGVLDALVPTLVLQPLIENAIRHGVASVSSPCTVSIIARRLQSVLQLEVTDTGPGNIDGKSHRNGGVGLQNTRERLRHLYGDECQIQAGNDSNGGFRVFIEIPYCENDCAEEDAN